MSAQEKMLGGILFTDGVVETVVDETTQGAILVSENTRLTKSKGTLTRRPKVTTLSGATVPTGTVCGGLVTSGETALAVFKPNYGQQRIVLGAIAPLLNPLTGVGGMNAYFPYPVTDAGIVPAASVSSTPASAIDANGGIWVAWIGQTLTGTAVFVTRIDSHGIERASAKVADISSASSVAAQLFYWVGLAVCTAGVAVFHSDDNGLSYNVVTALGATLTVGALHTFYVPIGKFVADVATDGTNTCLVLCGDSAVATSSVIVQVDVGTAAVVTKATFTLSVTSVVVYYALTYVNIGGVGYLGFAIADPSAGTTFGCVRPATPTVLWKVNTAGYGTASMLPQTRAGAIVWVLALSSQGAAVSTALTSTTFVQFALLTGTFVATTTVPWVVLQSRGRHHKLSDAEIYVYYPLMPCWTTASATALPAKPLTAPSDWVQDISIEVCTLFNNDTKDVLTPVMRFGVDKASTIGINRAFLNSDPMCVSAAGELGLVYAEDRIDQSYNDTVAKPCRYVRASLLPTTQPATAQDTQGVSIVAGALPYAFDGRQTFEYGFMHTPRVVVAATGGVGTSLTGSFFVTAVVSYRDTGGNIRRSQPSLPFPITLAAQKPIVYLTIPLTTHNGTTQPTYLADIYWSLDGGSLFFAQYQIPSSTSSFGCYVYNNSAAPQTLDIALYTNGTDILLPECPPALHDVRAVAGRFWAIPAENRYSILPSKLKDQGIAFEFNGALAMFGFDAQFGKLQAICEVGGRPFALAERAIWALSPTGPDNAGTGAFQDPQVIYTQGCLARETVAHIPGGGVIFQARDQKFVKFDGQVTRFESFGKYSVGTPTIHLYEQEVIYPLTDGSGFVVYNWLADGWVHWPTSPAIAYQSVNTVLSSATNTTLSYLYAPADGAVSQIDSSSVDNLVVAPMTVARGWMTPEGQFGACVFRQVWFHGLSAGSHGVTITVAFDLNESSTDPSLAPITRTWSAAEVATLTASGRYDLCLDCQARNARSIKVTIVATPASVFVTECWEPISMDIVYGVNPGQRQRTLLAGMKK